MLILRLMSGPATVNDSVEEGTEDDFVGGWSGNERRKLWKSTCTRAALNVRTLLNGVILLPN